MENYKIQPKKNNFKPNMEAIETKKKSYPKVTFVV
jgi:hypothetical protein